MHGTRSSYHYLFFDSIPDKTPTTPFRKVNPFSPQITQNHLLLIFPVPRDFSIKGV
ncbi:hypothetical protein ADICYQ_2770 [Cyclobacterium qasimii M12-11B]|uniref:Uncharacterized protein n=1 Tax=Cyclobacterium qasimii M12-11B TaxID=641524 RepID=S7VDJ3_9BACT|nr:hypothetical protein ADICYQ_2770 [Cyclobacterium qasimii M12-11B]